MGFCSQGSRPNGLDIYADSLVNETFGILLIDSVVQGKSTPASIVGIDQVTQREIASVALAYPLCGFREISVMGFTYMPMRARRSSLRSGYVRNRIAFLFGT